MSIRKRAKSFVTFLSCFVICFLMLTGCGMIEEYVPDPSELIVEKYDDIAEETNISEDADVISEDEDFQDASEDEGASEEVTAISEDEGNSEDLTAASEDEETSEEKYRVEFTFRNKKLLNQHYEKHGIDMGFSSAEEYEKAACDVIYNPDALKKKEKEDGDYVFYVEETNEFVVVSSDGYIRTYFLPDSGKSYYDRQ